MLLATVLAISSACQITCPVPSSHCGCDWTHNGTRCGSDDGSECFCRCCCSHEHAGFVCKWQPPPPPPPPPPPLPPPPPPPPGVTSPHDMIAAMGLGINLGNTLEAPYEGNWAPAAQESFFDEYQAAVRCADSLIWELAMLAALKFHAQGFTNVRIPVQWDHHTATTPPYKINRTFLERVDEVVDWSLKRRMITVINTHHENWLDNPVTFEAQLPRLVAIWEQISLFFHAKDQTLLFEIFNEPHLINVTQLNKMNEMVLPRIRVHNPTRIVFLGGLQFMNPRWQTANPWAMTIPPGDTQLALEIHNYDPFKYASCKTSASCTFGRAWGTAADREALEEWMDSIQSWSASHHLPIYYGEFGCTHAQNASSGRLQWYEAHAAGIAKHGFAASVWDDDGMFRVFDRQANTWDQGVLTALGKKLPPPRVH